MAKYIRTNLPALRFNNGRLSQKAVSEATGIGQKTLSALETGASKGIEFNTLIKLCTFFDCTPSEILAIEVAEDEDKQELPASAEARRQAKLLIAQGLQKAISLPAATPEEVWAKFDAVRLRIQNELEKQSSSESSSSESSSSESSSSESTSLELGINKQPRKRA